jgi:hypothetical protein
VLEALGRVLFNFISLEETISTTIYEAGAGDLSATRSLTAHGKQELMGQLAKRYRRQAGGEVVADVLDTAAKAFGHVRKTIRNEVLHAHPFTAGVDSEGDYLPGIGYTARDGKSWKTVARTPEDLLALAHEVEVAIGPLNAARAAVRANPLALR